MTTDTALAAQPETTPDCCNGPGLMPLADAWALLQSSIRPIEESEYCPLDQSTGRTLALAVRAGTDVPPFANSAMDGYAIHAIAGTKAGDCLQVVGQSLAGHPWRGQLNPGKAVRIMTGARVPDGTTAVVMQEHVERQQDIILLQHEPQPDDHIRPAGDDIRAGQTLLPAGQVIGPAQIGLLAAAGISSVPVWRRPRIALLSTGDELCNPGDVLQEGQINDTNRVLLKSLLHTLPVEVTDLGILPDVPARLEQSLLRAAESHDLILTSGGVSVGDTDFTRRVLERHGTISFWKLALKPGKPLAFGTLGSARFFGLPGNPVSALVTAYLVMLPALRQMAGQGWQQPLLLTARAEAPFRKKPGRTDYQRARLSTDARGQLQVAPAGPQGSHQLSVMSCANAFAVLPDHSGAIPEGDPVTVLPFPQTLSGIAL